MYRIMLFVRNSNENVSIISYTRKKHSRPTVNQLTTRFQLVTLNVLVSFISFIKWCDTPMYLNLLSTEARQVAYLNLYFHNMLSTYVNYMMLYQRQCTLFIVMWSWTADVIWNRNRHTLLCNRFRHGWPLTFYCSMQSSISLLHKLCYIELMNFYYYTTV